MKTCAQCGATVEPRRWSDGRMETPAEFAVRLYCSRSCARAASAARRLAADPSHVGSRRLVCRTCTKCLLLLPSDAFAKRRSGAHQWQCMACTSRLARTRPTNVARASIGHATRLADAQATTRARATRNGMQWSGAELEILAQHPDMPLRELAVMLGRTYAATNRKRSTLKTARVNV